jgi:hypothetical protein
MPAIWFHQPVPCIMVSMKEKQFVPSEDISECHDETDLYASFRDSDCEFKCGTDIYMVPQVANKKLPPKTTKHWTSQVMGWMTDGSK